MSQDMTFRGGYRYSDDAAVEAALAEVRAMFEIDDADPAISFETEIMRDGLAITVEIDVAGPGYWWDTYETVVEALASHAIDGKVEATIEGADGVETFPASAL